jgi:hypothetical protein
MMAGSEFLPEHTQPAGPIEPSPLPVADLTSLSCEIVRLLFHVQRVTSRYGARMVVKPTLRYLAVLFCR